MRLLVAEDEPRMAELLRRGLREEGYSVDIATGGTDALWLGKEIEYDAIVLDVMLPELDGIEICRQLRRHDCWTPVIMLTARTGVADRVRGLDAGADDYLAKPFSLVELSARLRALIRRGAVARPAVLRAGTLRLDPATRQVWRGDQPISLSATEFSLLELFMRHPGEVLTRSRILEHVWDFGYDAASNVVDQYVGYLRRKIDRPFGRADLETVRGAGYRLRAGAEPQPRGDAPGGR